MKSYAWVLLLLVGGVAWAVEVVDQGRPGRQGPWPVTLAPSSGSSGTPAGAVETRPYNCAVASPYASTAVAQTAAVVPTTASTAPRAYMVVCNTKQNAGNMKCRGDGVAPVFAAGNAGDYLEPGQCIKYTQANISGASPVRCISDQAANFNVTTFECL